MIIYMQIRQYANFEVLEFIGWWVVEVVFKTFPMHKMNNLNWISNETDKVLANEASGMAEVDVINLDMLPPTYVN